MLTESECDRKCVTRLRFSNKLASTCKLDDEVAN